MEERKAEERTWEYVVKGGRRLRRGFTTGSCATAAAKAATQMLFSGETVDVVSILTPAGIRLNLPVRNILRSGQSVLCSVQKDAGDDPDITAGLEIFASAVEKENPGVEVVAGEGVGMVTRPGLSVEVGKPAINPVPMAMILQEAGSVLPPGKGVRITISIPGGEEVAAKTFNPRLGIYGGLSILGTTGIVEPMSEEAFKESLALEMRMVSPAPGDPGFVVLVPGNYGKETARRMLGLPEKRIIKMSNFVGFMLDKCLEHGFQKILLVGQIGKLLKVAAGIFHTHSRMADARFEVFAAYASLLGAKRALIEELRRCGSSEEMVDKLETCPLEGFYDFLAARVSSRAEEYLYGRIPVGTVLFSLRKGLLGLDERAKLFLEEFACKKSSSWE